MHMMAKYQLLISLPLIICLKISKGSVCKEVDMMNDLSREKPALRKKWMTSWDKPTTPRSVIRALVNCTVYHGSIDIRGTSAELEEFNEDIRYEDFKYLKNLQRIYGTFQLELERFPDIKNLSFLSSLKEISTPIRRGFVLLSSEIEVMNFTNFRLGVPYAVLAHNKRLCYLDNFETLNRTTTFVILHNKDPKECAREGKVCSRVCNPRKGCWGPSARHCFECGQWTAGTDCVDSCESRRGFFTPSKGRICGQCHEECRYGCFGPKSTQCYPRPGLNCSKSMFYNPASKQCEDCSETCFGEGYDSRSQLVSQACSGPGDRPGPGGCSSGCRGMTFLNVSSQGHLSCVHCHAYCVLSCRNTSLSGCFRIKPPEPPKTPWRLLERNEDKKPKNTNEDRKPENTNEDRKPENTNEDWKPEKSEIKVRKPRPMFQDKLWRVSKKPKVARKEPFNTMQVMIFVIGVLMGLIAVLMFLKFRRKYRNLMRKRRTPSQPLPQEETTPPERPPRRETNQAPANPARNVASPRYFPFMWYGGMFDRRTAAPNDVFLALPLLPTRGSFPRHPRRMNAEPRTSDRGGEPVSEYTSLDAEAENDDRWTGRQGWSQVNDPRNRVVICSGRRRTVLRMWSLVSNQPSNEEETNEPSSTVS